MRSFIDTNVLVYADSADEPQRQARAVALIAEQRRQGRGVLSTQVLQEFVNVALRRLGLPPALVRERLAFYAGFDLVPTTPDLIRQALDLHLSRQVAFYDALIIQAAVVGGCGRLFSEDLQAGAVFERVRVQNPFAD